MSGRRVAKRACDGCKIRKIKCTEVVPCDGCLAAGIACTFVKQASVRGPRKPRQSTLNEISRTQQQWEELKPAESVSSEPVQRTTSDTDSFFAPRKVAALALQLCVYRLRMYPIWPIIKVERLVASLQKPDPDIEVFALAYAVAAATIAQIRTANSDQPGVVTAEMMETQCQYTKARRRKDQPPDLTTVRIPFFLHIYYENLEPGGLQSITYLREAIAVAHMVGLHRESYYANVPQEEQEIRRRTLWLLFVTERVVSILHKLPVTLKTKIALPSTNDTDEQEVLLAYHKLVSMFWKFDQAGVFELLDNQDDSTSVVPTQAEALVAMRKNLEEDAVEPYRMNEMQALDITVTRQWMRVILWRLYRSHGFFSQGSDATTRSLTDPISIAKELLQTVDRMTESAVKDHGPALANKVFEIASSVVDTMALAINENTQRDIFHLENAPGVLSRLEKLLVRSKGLHGRLCNKIARLQQSGYFDLNLNFSPPHPQEDTTMTSVDFEHLQLDNFDFNDILGLSDGTGADSLTTDW